MKLQCYRLVRTAAPGGGELQTLSDLHRTACTLKWTIFPLLGNNASTEQWECCHEFVAQLRHRADILRSPASHPSKEKNPRCPQETQSKMAQKIQWEHFPSSCRRQNGRSLTPCRNNQANKTGQATRLLSTWIKAVDKRRTPISPKDYF